MAGARRGPGRRGRRRIGTTVAALLLAGAGGAYAVTHRPASAQTQPRTLTVTRGTEQQTVSVISTNAWVVQTQVGNADLASLKRDMQAQILPTGSRTTIYGTVESIGIVASSSSSSTSPFPVTIAVTGAPVESYAGTAASVSIISKQLDDVLTVPTAALSSSDGRTTVTVLQNGQQVPTPVTVGRIFGARTEVTAGLSDGAQVVLPGTGGTGGTGGNGTRTGGLGGGGFGGGGFGGGGGATGGTTARNGG